MKLHKLPDANLLQELAVEERDFLRQTSQQIASGRANLPACYRTLTEGSFKLACISLLRNAPDHETRQYVSDAARHALEWLRAPGAVGGPRAYDVSVSVVGASATTTAIHEKPSSRQPSKLTIGDYTMILMTTMAFGSSSDFSEVASFPEDGYRNPNIVIAEDAFTHVRALKAYLLGKMDEARREARATLAAAKDPAMEALLAILDGDRAAFLKHLEARLEVNKKHYQKNPNDPSGFVNLPGMALCRLALDKEVSIEEGPYLPLRFLPNYAGAPKA